MGLAFLFLTKTLKISYPTLGDGLFFSPYIVLRVGKQRYLEKKLLNCWSCSYIGFNWVCPVFIQQLNQLKFQDQR